MVIAAIVIIYITISIVIIGFIILIFIILMFILIVIVFISSKSYCRSRDIQIFVFFSLPFHTFQIQNDK